MTFRSNKRLAVSNLKELVAKAVTPSVRIQKSMDKCQKVNKFKSIDISDVVIDFGLTELKNVGGSVFICDESVQRLILGIYENMEYLYDVLAGD